MSQLQPDIRSLLASLGSAAEAFPNLLLRSSSMVSSSSPASRRFQIIQKIIHFVFQQTFICEFYDKQEATIFLILQACG